MTTTQPKPQMKTTDHLICATLTVLLVATGFLMDGVTEIGHHALLIAAGMVLGGWIVKLRK